MPAARSSCSPAITTVHSSRGGSVTTRTCFSGRRTPMWRFVRPLAPRVTLRVGYDLAHTSFDRAESTDSAFQVPASQWAHGFRVELHAQRYGWTFGGWWSPAKRAGWRPWGPGDAGEPERPALPLSPAGFQRWGASAGRTMLLSRALTGRVEAVYMDGRGLDRFSRYAFGTFDNRLKGYPSASVRFDRGGIARTALAWQAGPRLRLDGFFDAALCSRSRPRPSRPRLRGHRRRRRDGAAVWPARWCRVGLRLSGRERRRLGRYPCGARHDVQDLLTSGIQLECLPKPRT